MSNPQKQSRITGAISLLIAQGVVLMLGYVTHLLIGRLLGPGPYGIYGVVLSVQSIIGMFLTLGVPSAISRFVAQDEKHAHSILTKALKIQAIIGVSLAAIALLSAPVIARLLNDQSLTPLLSFIAVVVLFQAFYPVYIQFLSGMHRFNRQAALTAIYAVAKLAGAITLLFVFGVFGAFAGFAVGGIIAAGVGWAWTRRLGGREEKKLSTRGFLSFAGVYVLILVGLQLLMSIDLFMIKAILQDDVQAGYYNAAVTLSRISYFLLQGLSFILLPSVSALTRPGVSHTEAARFIGQTLRYLIALIVPAIALAAATSKQLVILFFSNEFIPAAPVLTVLMVGLGALAFYLLLANIVAGAGRAKRALYLTCFLLVLSVGLGSVLIPMFGLIGAAWQTTSTALIGLILLGIYTFYTFKISFPVKSTINIIIATVLAVLPTYIWKASSFALIGQYILLLALYAGILFIIGEVTKEDRRRLASIHPKLAWVAKK